MRRHGAVTTSGPPEGLPRPARGGRRFASRSAVLGLLGFGLASVTAHNVQRVVRLRQHARSLRTDLDHDGAFGSGVGAPIGLWVLGDSASDGYGLPEPDHAFPRHVATALASATSRRVAVTSLGRDGARIAQVAATQAPLLRPTADAVVVLVGANDVFGRRSAAQVDRDVATMLDAVARASEGAVVAVAGCPDFGRAPGFPQPLRMLLGWRCRVVARAMAAACSRAGVPFVDLVPGTAPELFGADGVHPGREGSMAAAAAVVEALVAAAGDAVTARPDVGDRSTAHTG